MTRYVLVFMILLASENTRSCVWATSEADSLYQVALDNLDHTSPENSIKDFQNVIKVDNKYAPAYNQLARLYMSQNTPVFRQRAEAAIKRALALDRENLAYHLTMGELYWEKGMWHRAANYFERVIAQFPDASKAAFQLGFYALKEFLLVQDRGRAFQDFAKRDTTMAIYLLERCIELNPDFRDAYYQLGVLYQETRHPEKLIAVSERLLARFPEDKDALLFAALGYQTRGDYAQAADLYERALMVMDADERAMMEAVDLIAEDEAEKLLASASPVVSDTWQDEPAREKFWKRRNPLFLTDFNERRMAHYGRVAYANLRFTQHSDLRTPGWKTGMGRAWIKFGRFVHKISGFLTETWYYEDFELLFTNWNGLDAWRYVAVGGEFAPTVNMRVSTVEEFFRRPSTPQIVGRPVRFPSDPLHTQKPRYVDPYVTRKYSLPHQVVAFKAGDSVRVEVAFGIPQDRLQDADGIYHLTEGIFIFDEDWNDLMRETNTASLTWPAATKEVAGASQIRLAHLMAHRFLTAGPEIEHLVVEVMDDIGLKIGTLRRDEAFGFGPGLTITEPLLATRIEPLRPDVRSRADLSILPNPIRVFDRSELVNVYFEMYNLQRDVFGRTRYTVSYEIRRPEKQVDPTLFRAIDLAEAGRMVLEEAWPHDGDEADSAYRIRFVIPDREALEEEFRALVRQADRSVTRVTAEYEGDRADDLTYLAIDVRQMPLGIYELIVEINDLHSGAISRRTVVFQIVA